MTNDPDGLCEFDTICALLPAYDFDGLIGRGVSGSVYKARQRSLDRDVAIRVLPRDGGGDPGFRASFLARAKSMAKLTHPGLVRVYDSGDLGGLHYLVMEYVPGNSLHHSARGKAVDPRQAVQIVIAACRGLAHAHRNGIAHGAIHPADILLTPNCEPKIASLGCSGHSPDDGVRADAKAYMAPELANGGVSGNPQSDVHSMGVVLRELLTGIPAGTTEASQTAVSDPRLAAICQKAAHPDPEQRYADAAALAAALERWMAPVALKPVSMRRQPSARRPLHAPLSRPKSRPGRALLANCMIIACLLFAIHALWGVYQEKKETLARLQQIEDAKPRVIIVNAEPATKTPPDAGPMIVQFEP